MKVITVHNKSKLGHYPCIKIDYSSMKELLLWHKNKLGHYPCIKIDYSSMKWLTPFVLFYIDGKYSIFSHIKDLSK